MMEAATTTTTTTETERLRRRLKDWEARFVRKYGRKPSKADVASRPHVADEYKKYERMRKGIVGADARSSPHVGRTAPSASAEFVRSPFTGRGARARGGDMHAQAAACRTPTAARVSAIDEFRSGGHGGDLMRTPTAKMRCDLAPGGGSGDSSGGGGRRLLAALQACSPTKATANSLTVPESAAFDVVGPSPVKAPRLGRGPVAPAPRTAAPLDDDLNVDFDVDDNGMRSALAAHAARRSGLAVADKYNGRSHLTGHSPMPNRSKQSSAIRKPSILNQIPTFFRKHPQALASIGADATNSTKTQTLDLSSSRPTISISSSSESKEIAARQKPAVGDDAFGPSLNKFTCDGAQSGFRVDDDHSGGEDTYEDDRRTIRKVAEALPKRAVQSDKQHSKPPLLQSKKPASVIPAPSLKPQPTDSVAASAPEVVATSAPRPDPSPKAIVPLVRPHNFVNARTLRRVSSRTLDLPTNYHEFLSEKEQRMFADVIRDVRDRVTQPEDDHNVDAMDEDHAEQQHAPPRRRCVSPELGFDAPTLEPSGQESVLAENSGVHTDGGDNHDQSTNALDPQAPPMTRTRSKRPLRSAAAEDANSESGVAVNAADSIKRRKNSKSAAADAVVDSDSTTSTRKTPRLAVSHWSSGPMIKPSTSKSKDSDGKAPRLASSNFRALNLRGRRMGGGGKSSSSSSWRGKRSYGGGGGGFRRGGGSFGMRRRSWSTKDSLPRRVHNAFGELEQIESQARLDTSVRESVDTLPVASGVATGAAPGSSTAINAAPGACVGNSDTAAVAASIPIDFLRVDNVDDDQVGPEWVRATFGCLDRPVLVNVDLALQRMCRLDSFRAGQRETIVRILEGKSTLLVLPTGGGKSLCYQLPALVLRHVPHAQPCLTLVVSPTISLMLDQMRCLPPSLRAACLSSANQSASASRDVYARLEAGEIDVLFVAPERLRSTSFLDRIRTGKIPTVRFVCVDEAHCLSEWSHNFRPSYLHLREVLQSVLRVRCVVALTATATIQTRSSICAMLDVDPSPHSCSVNGSGNDAVLAATRTDSGGVIAVSAVRYNIHVSASKVATDDEREEALLRLLRSREYRHLDSIIIYVMFQYQADRIAQFLRIRDFDADGYHAGKSPEQREHVQSRFLRGKLRIVVATVAFGLGINKHNVRSVIHYALPKSVEDYVQEVGRCGRDGLPAYCHLFMVKEDYVRQRSFAFSDGLDEGAIWRLLIGIFGEPDAVDGADGSAKAGNSSPELLPPSSPTRPSLDKDDGGIDSDSGEEEEDTDVAPVRRLVIPIDVLEMDLDARESVLSTLLSCIELSDISDEGVHDQHGGRRTRHGRRRHRPLIRVHPIINAVHTIYVSKTRLEGLTQNSALVRHAVRLGHSVSHGVEFDTLDVAEAMDMSPQDLVSELWRLQSANRFLKFAGSRRAFNISIYWSPPESDVARGNSDSAVLTHRLFLERLRDRLVTRMQTLENAAVHKLDQLYGMLYDIVPESDESVASRAASRADDIDSSTVPLDADGGGAGGKHGGSDADAQAGDHSVAQRALMERIRLYFEDPNAGVHGGSGDNDTASRWGFHDPEIVERQKIAKAHVEISIKEFVHAHGQEVTTGRAVARIFHGLSSPRYQAKEWSRNKHWNSFPFYNFKGLAGLAGKVLAEARARESRGGRGRGQQK